MEEENIIKIAKLGAGVFLATLYAVTGANGVITLLAAFLLGIPLEQFVTKRRQA